MAPNPVSPGSRPELARDPATGRLLPVRAWDFPGGAEGIYAPGPLGQADIPAAPPRAWWPEMPPTLQPRQVVLNASGGGQNNRVEVPAPTLVRIIGADSFRNAATERAVLAALPEETTAPSALAYHSAGGLILLPSPGVWYLRCQSRDVTGANLADTWSAALLDATSIPWVDALYPLQTPQRWASADTAIGIGADVQVLTIQEVTDATRLEIVNVGANEVRVSFGAASTAVNGFPLSAFGTPGDRVKWSAGAELPMQSIHVFSAAGSAVSVSVWSV